MNPLLASLPTLTELAIPLGLTLTSHLTQTYWSPSNDSDSDIDTQPMAGHWLQSPTSTSTQKGGGYGVAQDAPRCIIRKKNF